LAEQFYLSRAIEPLAEAAELLISLPDNRAQAAGRFYLAMRSFRQGDLAQAARLLESVAGIETAPRYRARALQSLGIIYRRENDNRQAAKLYYKAANLAASMPQQDLVTIIRAGMNISYLCSIEGDHKRALGLLKAIRPAISTAARVAPVYAASWCNEVAYELAHLGRVNEARQFSRFAIVSPFARAYPEWQATALEIEKQAREKAARKRAVRPAVERARSTPIRSKLRLVKKPRPRALPAPTRRRTGPAVIIRPEPPRSRPTLEQVCLKIRIRAPSI